MFRTQLRAILRAAAHGPVRLMFPMLAHRQEILQTLAQVAQARQELQAKRPSIGPVQLGAMIEVPAAAIMVDYFLQHFDFIDWHQRPDPVHLWPLTVPMKPWPICTTPCTPAVLQLVAQVIAAGQAAGKPVCVCGEVAGDVSMIRLLLGMGLRSHVSSPVVGSQTRGAACRHPQTGSLGSPGVAR